MGLSAIKTLMAFQPVDINKASAQQFALLPQIGEKLAHEIIAYRSEHGLFKNTSDLLSVKGLTAKRLAAISDKIVVETNKTKKKNIVSEPVVIEIKKPPQFYDFLHQVLIAQGLDTTFDKSLETRARKAFWLPTLTAGFELDEGAEAAKKRDDKGLDSLHSRGGRDYGFMVRVSFNLDKLIFNRDELEVAKLSLKRLEIREQVIKQAHQQYFAYVDLYNATQKPLEHDNALKLAFEAYQLLGQLDAMSRGAFSRMSTDKT